MATLDSFAAAHGIARLDVVKADVEGWEGRVLAGGAETLRRFRPPMLLELIDSHLRRAGDTLPAAWAMLTDWGYSAYLWQEGELVPCLSPRDGDTFWLPLGAPPKFGYARTG